MSKFSSIYFYFPYRDRDTKSGIGWVCHAFRCAFPEGEELLSPYDILKLGRKDILFVPRIFPLPFAGENFNKGILLSHILQDTKAIIVQTPFWDGEEVPLQVFASLGRVDILHAASKFLHTLFRGVAKFGVVEVGIPVRDWGKIRVGAQAPSPTVGGVIASPHPRKNPSAYFRIAGMLSNFRFRIVFPIHPAKVKDWCNVDVDNYPNVEILYDLSDDELRDFYASLDYFLVLSGGEGYCIPVREAMKAGVPVIVPSNTVFLEFDGLQGVYLIPTKLLSINVDTTCNQLYRFPVLEEVVNFLWNNPTCDVEVSKPPMTPSLDEFRVTLLSGVEKLLPSDPTVVVSKEVSSVWVTYPFAHGVGLSATAQTWAKRTNGLALPFFSVFSETHYPKTPVIIPYRPGLFDGLGGSWDNEVFKLITTLVGKSIRPPIAIWLHAAVPEHLVYLFRRWGVILLTTHPDYAKSLGALHLPLPIGDPPKQLSTQTFKNLPPNFFISWGVNYAQLEGISILVPVFVSRKIPLVVHVVSSRGLPPIVLQKIAELEVWSKNHPFAEFFTLLVSPPLQDDELEALLDQAQGYIIFDDERVSLPYEVSAKLPQVLRKGKPIIANAAPRLAAWGEFINLLPFSLSAPQWLPKAQCLIAHALSNLEVYIPHNVPTLEEEAQKVIATIIQLRDLFYT